MENEASQLVDKLNELLEKNDSETAWYLQKEMQRVWNSLPPYSEGREKLSAVWEKMMIKWH
jgi:hypothetical protein